MLFLNNRCDTIGTQLLCTVCLHRSITGRELLQPPTSPAIKKGAVLVCPIKYKMKINQKEKAPIKFMSF